MFEEIGKNKDKDIILPRKFYGRYAEDYIEAIKELNPLTFIGSIYDKMSHIIAGIIHKELGLPFKPIEKPEEKIIEIDEDNSGLNPTDTQEEQGDFTNV